MNEIIYPLISLLVGTVLSLIVGKFHKGDFARLISVVSIATAIALLAVFKPFTGESIFNDLIILDTFGGFFVYLFLGLAIAVIIGSTKMLDEHPEMPSLIIVSVIGMALVSITNDLIMLFVAWEIMSISTYVLAGIGTTKRSTESAMKYFIYGSVSSALILFAISLIYGITGTTHLDAIISSLSGISSAGLSVIMLSAIIFIFGFGYKMGMVPFHLWLPDVYEGSPAPISGLLAGVAKKVAIVAAVRIFLYAFVSADFNWKILFAILAVITMTIGNIAALSQKNVVRMFAYSSISQIGYILVGFAILTSEGLAAAMMQTTMHALTTVGVFISIGLIAKKKGLFTYDDYKGLGAKNPIIGIGLTVMMLSLAGIPPLGGFISKLYLFTAAVRANLLWLAIVFVLNSVLSLGYYLPLIRNMYLEKSSEDVEKQQEIDEPKEKKFDTRSLGPVIINVLTFAALIVIPIFAQKLFDLIIEAAKSII